MVFAHRAGLLGWGPPGVLVQVRDFVLAVTEELGVTHKCDYPRSHDAVQFRSTSDCSVQSVSKEGGYCGKQYTDWASRSLAIDQCLDRIPGNCTMSLSVLSLISHYNSI